MTKRYNHNDIFFRKAKKEGYRARSVYKLMEINDKFKILKKNIKILDLGSAPGSWLQYLSQFSDQVYGVDLKEIEEIDNVILLQEDIFNKQFLDKISQVSHTQKFDVITSDIAPKTTGISDVDQYASVELNLEVLEVMKKKLKPNGWGVFKIFRGEDFNDFWFEAKKHFPNMKTFKPKACRDRSFEIYCIGKIKKI